MLNFLVRKSRLLAISILLTGGFACPSSSQAIETMEEVAATTALAWIKCNDGLRQKSSLYKEAENLFRSTGIETSLLLDSRLDAIAQATIDENPFKVCERFMGFRLKTSIINAGKNADTNLQYMANWKKKSALRMADYICQHRTLELTDAQLERLYNDIVLITKQEGVERYVDDYAIESSLFEIAEAAGVIAFKRKQNGTCQILD